MSFSTFRLIRGTAFIMVVASISACAQPYKSIEPDLPQANSFSQMGCSKMRDQRSKIISELRALEERQEKAVAQDIISVLFIGIPTSGGGKNKEISEAKGQKHSLEKAMTEDNCSLT